MRVAIAKEVESINPADSLEEEHQEDVLMWINSGAELFRLKKPDTPPKHLVSYFVVIDGDYVLLVDHKNAQLWLPSGGHVDPEEHPRDTVIREAYEELKIKADLRRWPESKGVLLSTLGMPLANSSESPKSQTKSRKRIL